MNIDDLLKRIEKLETEIKEMHQRCLDILAHDPSTGLRVRVPGENTPINTICSWGPTSDKFLLRAIDGEYVILAELENNEYTEERENVVIDTVADLRFRMFLNAPENMKWGAIDKDGVGTVFEEKPSRGTKQWEIAGSDYLQVGFFPQYADEWDKILIEREA